MLTISCAKLFIRYKHDQKNGQQANSIYQVNSISAYLNVIRRTVIRQKRQEDERNHYLMYTNVEPLNNGL